MANINKFIPFIMKWEGGFVNDPADLGGATNRGVTLKTWQKLGYDKNGDGVINVEDLKLITEEDMVERVLRPHYWNRWQADRIRNQSIAHLLVDWLWTSGTVGITIPQGVLGVVQDGVVGEITLAAVNNYPAQQELFERIQAERVAYIERICTSRPANNRFKKGWLNRLNDIKWIPMALLFCFLLSCRTVKKTETLQQFVTESVGTFRADSLRREYTTERDERLWEDRNEQRTTESIRAIFDTLDSKPVLKELLIKRTVYGREVHTEQHAESRASGTETQTVEESIKSEVQTELHTELKEKPVRSSVFGWVTGGITLLILFVAFGWFVRRKIL